MSPPRKTLCKRGHRLAGSNIRQSKLASGYTVRKCKLCESLRDKLRYARLKAQTGDMR